MKSLSLLLIIIYTLNILSTADTNPPDPSPATNPPDPTLSPTIVTPTTIAPTTSIPTTLTPSTNPPDPTTTPAPPLPCYPQFTLSVADASGDPHFKTLDGSHHDFQGVGIYSWIEDDYVNVQVQTQKCNPNLITSSVSCIRKVWTETKPTGSSYDMSLKVSWGYIINGANPNAIDWSKLDSVYITQTIKGVTTIFPPFLPKDMMLKSYNPLMFLDGLFSVKYDGSRVIIAPNALHPSQPNKNPDMAISHVIGSMYYAISLPNVAPHLGVATGVLAGGLFNGDPSDDFCVNYKNGTQNCCYKSATQTKSNNRVNSNACNLMWLNNYSITSTNPRTDSSYNKLMSHYHHTETNELMDIQTAPNPNSIPSSAETDILVNLNFDNLDDAEGAIKFCQAAFGILANQNLSQTDMRMQNCIMDAQLIYIQQITAATNSASQLITLMSFGLYDDPTPTPFSDSFNFSEYGMGGLIASANAGAARASADLAIQIGTPTAATTTEQLSSAAIAGIVIACIVAFIAVIVTTYYCWRNSKLNAEINAGSYHEINTPIESGWGKVDTKKYVWSGNVNGNYEKETSCWDNIW